MGRKTIDFKHKVYKGHQSLPEPIQKLVIKAKKMTKRAYAPYSNFQVGAALQLTDGKVFLGCNQENASYPLCMCAERVALYSYGASGKKSPIKSLVITAHNPEKPLSSPCMPCGACRQVIQEYEQRQNKPIDIYVLANNLDSIYLIKGVGNILPAAFNQGYLI